MTLFAKCVVTVEDAERELKRPLTGDPSRGEHAVLAALDATRLGDARRILERDPLVRTDFRELIEERLRAAQTEPGELKSWTVWLPAALFEEYALMARHANAPVGECLAAAIQRDSDQRRQTLDVLAELNKAVLGYHRAAKQMLDELHDLMVRLGVVQEISARIARIEKALAGRNSPA